MVSEQSSSDEPNEGPKRKKATQLARNTWNALTVEEKRSRIKKAIKKGRNKTKKHWERSKVPGPESPSY